MTSLIGCATTSSSSQRPFFERIGKPIGLQIYTLGPEAGRDIDATFAQVAQIGYREIELPGLFGKKPADLGAAAARAGLTISSLHLPLVANSGPGLSLGSDASQIAEALAALGAHWAVAPILLFPPGFRPQSGESMEAAISRSVTAAGEDIWKKTANLLNTKGSELKPLGFKVGYHNHNLEFAPVGNTRGWDILWRETQPDLVSFEIDLGWIATAGLDPVEFLKSARGRVRLLHVKDVAAGNTVNFGITMKPAEVGSGTLDWVRILPEAQRAGVEHFLVEQEPPFTIPRIEAAAKSYAFLSQLKA
ncbi:MAG: sugar phosphate isomerase/epimerase [Novosphingobium sp.]